MTSITTTQHQTAPEHAPWCNDHLDDDSARGYCCHTTRAGSQFVTVDEDDHGRPASIVLQAASDAAETDTLTVPEARSLAGALLAAVELVETGKVSR